MVEALPANLDGSSRVELAVRSKALGWLFLTGGTIVLLMGLWPHSPEARPTGVIAIAVLAYVSAAVLFGFAGRMSEPALVGLLAWGNTSITAVGYFSGEAPSPIVVCYLWVFLYSAYFFTRRQAIAQSVYAVLSFTMLLIVTPPPNGSGLMWWLVGINVPLTAGLLIDSMRHRAELLIERLYDAARTDPLTKLPNRRRFRELLDLELERARRSQHPVTVVIGDLDHFKEVNDRAGHLVGDAVLQRVARILESNGRRIDAAARIGGEEFGIVLPDTDHTGAMVVAERLRTDVRDEFAGDAVPVTISFGIATYPRHGETASSLLHAADEALYGAKRSGRNRSVLHSPALGGMSRGMRERDIAGERFLAVVLDLAEAIDLRFSGSARHSETVGRYAEMMARDLGLSERRIGRVRLAGMLHDIGKVAVPEEILKKTGALTDAEVEVIRRHPQLGADILQHPSLADVKAWVLAHHERPDGQGYPRGLAGDALPLEARIVAVADAYEAMTSDRTYRNAIGHQAAREELRRCAGTQFDAQVVDVFLRVLDRESARADAVLAR